MDFKKGNNGSGAIAKIVGIDADSDELLPTKPSFVPHRVPFVILRVHAFRLSCLQQAS